VRTNVTEEQVGGAARRRRRGRHRLRLQQRGCRARSGRSHITVEDWDFTMNVLCGVFLGMTRRG
jgi:hypothetical protein